MVAEFTQTVKGLFIHFSSFFLQKAAERLCLWDLYINIWVVVMKCGRDTLIRWFVLVTVNKEEEEPQQVAPVRRDGWFLAEIFILMIK